MFAPTQVWVLDVTNYNLITLPTYFESSKLRVVDSALQLEDQIQSVNESVQCGYAAAFTLPAINSSNWTAGALDKSDQLQIPMLWAGLSINEMKTNDLVEQSEMMQAKMGKDEIKG